MNEAIEDAQAFADGETNIIERQTVQTLLDAQKRLVKAAQHQASLIDAAQLFVRRHRETGEYDALAYTLLADAVDALKKDEQA